MHLLGFIFENLCDELEGLDHGVKLAVTAECDLKFAATVMINVCLDGHICAAFILDAEVGATAVPGVAFTLTCGTGFDRENVAVIDIAGIGCDFSSVTEFLLLFFNLVHGSGLL
jgi:hypothetical protein